MTSDPDRRLVTDHSSLLADLLPEFWNARELSWGAAHANLRSFDEVARVPGLFWSDGWGRYHRGLLWAIVLLHQQASLVTDPMCVSGYSASNLRADLERGDIPIGTDVGLAGWDPLHVRTFYFDIDSLGRYSTTIRVGGRGPFQAWGVTYGGRIHVLDASFTFAGNADFYLHWAHRLYDRWIVEGDQTSRIGARLCARAALAEVAGLATILAHEYFHLFRRESYECRSGTAGRERQNCVTFVASYTFLHRVLCRFGLPLPMNVQFYPWIEPDDNNRFYFGPGLASGPRGTHYMTDKCQPDPSVDPISYQHANFWSPSRTVTLSISIPTECSSTDTALSLVNTYTG